jgi:hypothetical protein
MSLLLHAHVPVTPRYQVSCKRLYSDGQEITVGLSAVMEPEGSLQFSQNYPLGPTLNQLYPVHTFSHRCSYIHFNIILPYTFMSPKWDLSE